MTPCHANVIQCILNCWQRKQAKKFVGPNPRALRAAKSILSIATFRAEEYDLCTEILRQEQCSSRLFRCDGPSADIATDRALPPPYPESRSKLFSGRCEFVRGVARIARIEELRIEVEDFADHPDGRGIVYHWLKLRTSRDRMNRLVRETMKD